MPEDLGRDGRRLGAVPLRADELSVVLSFYVPESVRAEIQTRAHAEDVSLSAWLRRIVVAALK